MPILLIIIPINQSMSSLKRQFILTTIILLYIIINELFILEIIKITCKILLWRFRLKSIDPIIIYVKTLNI